MSTYDYRTQLVELNGVASIDIHVGYFASFLRTGRRFNLGQVRHVLVFFFCIVERFCSVLPPRYYEVEKLVL